MMKQALVAVALAALGLLAGAGPARASSVADLEGAWAVAHATMDGAARVDRKVLNATWTFRGTELVVQNAQGERMRAALSFDATAQPPAFHITPLDSSRDRPLWAIWMRQGDELRVAFYDGIDQRPEDFGPRRKLVVLTLVPARAAPASAGPCEILRVAGVDRLLGGPTLARPDQDRGASVPGSSCALDRNDNTSAIALTLIAAPAGPGYVDVARRQAQANLKMQIADEPALGPGAFSGAKGWTVLIVALKGGTAMVLRVDALNADRAELRRFAQRVLDAL